MMRAGHEIERRNLSVATAAGLILAGGACSPAVPDQMEIRVKGSGYEWHMHYPGPDNEFGTSDDVHARRDLHVPQQTQISLALASDDYVYRISIPEFGVNEMAIPELDFSASFEPESAGDWVLQGDQLCGFSHSSLIGRVYVHPRSRYFNKLRETMERAR